MPCNGLHTHVVKGSLVLKRLATNGRDSRGGIPVSDPQVSTWGAKQISDIPRPHRKPELNSESCAYLSIWRCSIAPVNPEGQCPHCHYRQWFRRNISSLELACDRVFIAVDLLCACGTTCQYWHHIAGHHNMSPSCLLLLSCGLGSWCQGLLQPATDYWVVREN